MPAWIHWLADVMGRGAIAATPAVVLLALLVRFVGDRPATRHALWVLALVWFVVASALSQSDWTLYQIRSAIPQSTGFIHHDEIAEATRARESLTAPRDSLPSERNEAMIHRVHASSQDPTPPRTGVGPATDWSIPLAQTVCPPSRRRSDSLASIPSVDSADFGTTMASSATNHTLNPDPAPNAPHVLPVSVAWSTWMRDRLGPAPVYGWLAGVVLLLLLRLIGVMRFAVGLRSVEQVPPDIAPTVEACAREMGLRRVPRVWVVDNRISPMVWWLGRRCLILPRELWRQLDPDGRRAIVYHELAHLRRGDDRVRWLQLAISALHWWHPLVWWVDRRVREEAETCCDAWVTWLMPNGRRSYASALLATSEYVRRGAAPSPVSIGVISVRARRMARRLTMVMTNRAQRPFLNGSGLAVASLLAALAWMTTPAWSKPPTADEKLKQEHEAMPDSTRVKSGAVESGSRVDLMRSGSDLLHGVVSVSDEPSTKETVKAKRRRLSDDDVEARIARLERMIEELAARRASPPAVPARPATPRQPMPTVAATARPGAPEVEGRVEVTYRLSRGKLDALVTLMSRHDVPVLIERRDDTIVVHATPAQQEAFRAFVELIEPETAGAAVPGTPRTPRARGFGVLAPRVAPAPPVAPKLRRAIHGAHRAELHRAIEQIHQERDRIEERVESLHDKAEAMREAAERLKDRPREDALREVKVIEQAAEELSRHLEQLDQQTVEMESALEEVDTAAEMDDEDATPAPDDDARSMHDARAAELFAARQWKDAAEAYRDALHDKAEDGQAWYQFGYALHRQAKYDEAIAAFQRAAELNARPSDSLYNIACGYSLKGDVERAFEWLEKAHEAGYEDLDHMRSDSDLKTLHEDPRFEKLLSDWSR